jgi:release factor glutamine methyltransferase
VEVIKSNGLDAVPDKSADLICANLPYIPSAECKNLPADIRYYEPMTALDGGRDGLEIIRVVLEQSLQKLLPTGHIILELGEGQAPIVMDLCQKLGFTNVYAEKDLSGIQRAVVASQNH